MNKTIKIIGITIVATGLVAVTTKCIIDKLQSMKLKAAKESPSLDFLDDTSDEASKVQKQSEESTAIADSTSENITDSNSTVTVG